MSEIIMVASGKGGVGKTTVAASIGVSLSQLNKRVCLIDFDFGLRNLDLALGLEDMVVFDIVDVALENCKLREAVIKDSKYMSLGFIPASQFKDDVELTNDKFASLINELKRKYDYIIIDCPAGIGENVQLASEFATMAIVVVNPEPYSLRDADKLIACIESHKNIKDTRLVVNRIRKEFVKKGLMLTVNDIIEVMGVRLIGVVPEDKSVIEASIKGIPAVMMKKSKTASRYYDIARRICGENVPLTDIKRKRFFFK